MLQAESERIKGEVESDQLELVYTAEDKLGKVISSAPGDNLDLLSLHFRMRVFETPSSLVFSVDFPDSTFYGERFIDLLNNARRRSRPEERPYNRLNLVGTVADWRMPDQSREKQNKHDHEEGLLDAFIQFDMRDRRKFLYAAAPLKKEDSLDFMRKQSRRLLTTSMDQTRRLDVEEMLTDSSLNISSVTAAGKKLILPDTNIHFEMLPNELKAKIIMAAEQADLGRRIVFDPESNPAQLEMGFSPEPFQHPYTIFHRGRGIVEINYGYSYARFSYRNESAKPLRLNIADQADYYISPWQVWAKAKVSKERIWLDNPLPYILTEGIDHRTNIRSGFVLATALSAERDALPDKLPLSPYQNPQDIREAQTPVLVYLGESDIRRLVGENPRYQIMDPHLTILNGSYFRSFERSAT